MPAPDPTQFTLNLVGVLALVIQVLLPLLVALVTKWTTQPWVKGAILLVLSALTQFLTLWYQSAQNNIDFDWKQVLYTIIVGFVISVGAHFGLWQTTPVRTALQSVGSKDTVPTAGPDQYDPDGAVGQRPIDHDGIPRHRRPRD